MNCTICKREFEPTVHNQTKTCGDERCRQRWKNQKRSMHAKARNRERNREWCAKNRNVTASNPWLRGQPIYDSHLPGGACELSFAGTTRFEHSHVRALHGVVTSLLGAHEQDAVFSLIPWPRGCGWAVYCRTDSLARLAQRQHDARLGSAPVVVRLGPFARIKSPDVRKRGHRRVRISTVTPVVITTMGRKRVRLDPDADSIRSTLVQTIPARIGLGVERDEVPIELVDADTQTVRVDLGGKLGAIPGWDGSVVVETNAIGHWLLEVAARIGLGGRTALGFGRVRCVVV